IGTAMTLGTRATIRSILIGARLAGAVLIGTILIGSILIGAILIGTPATMPARRVVLPRLGPISDRACARHGLAGRSRGGCVSGGRKLGPVDVFGTRLRACARRPPVAPRTLQAARPPHLDELGFLGHRLGRHGGSRAEKR